VLLLILDGWGYREDRKDNALARQTCRTGAGCWRSARTRWWRRTACTSACRTADGQFGGRHMNIGAGRIVYQDLTRIDAAIADGSFSPMPRCSAPARRQARRRHAARVRPAQPGGVHSHEDQILALLDLAARRACRASPCTRFSTDATRRRRARRVAASSCRRSARAAGAHRGDVGGRYYAMDRDKRWERVKLAYDAIAEADAPFQRRQRVAALDAAYARGENDEFVKPTIIGAARDRPTATRSST
jgi:2,3-bisphosphoglycerate-independent phosphoglycerate mutase